MPVSPAATTGGGSDGGGGGGGGGASMMSKLSMPTLPSFGLGAGKEPIAMGDTAEKLKAKFKDGSSVRRRAQQGVGLTIRTASAAVCCSPVLRHSLACLWRDKSRPGGQSTCPSRPKMSVQCSARLGMVYICAWMGI